MAKKKYGIGQAFRDIIWPRRHLVFTGLLLIIVSKAASFVAPISLKYLIDDIIPSRDTETLKIVVLLVVIAISVQAVTSFLLTRIVSIQAQYLITELRIQVQEKVLSLPIRFFDNTKAGELVSRVMSDVEGARNLIGTGLVQLVGGAITAIVALLLLLDISVELTLFALLPLFLFALISMQAFKILRPIFRKRREIQAEVTGRLTETLSGIRVVKGFNAEDQEKSVFRKGVTRLFENIRKTMTASALIESSSTLLIGIATTGITGLGGYRIMMQELTLGEFFQFTFLMGLMIAPIVQISNIGTQLTEALAGLDRTQDLMQEETEEEIGERHIELDRIQGDIRFEGVGFAYDVGKPVLHGIDLEIRSGKTLALVGSSGSGKSTIAGLVAGFIQPSSGRVTIDGHDLSRVSIGSYRKHLGVVLQDDFLFEGTIRDNVVFARTDATEVEIRKAVEAAYVNEFTDSLEDGLDTWIGERGIKLSGGQRQRITIARALLANPDILILDEATSQLDTQSESLIQKSLQELIRDRTTLIIAHRLSTIRSADQILVVDQGRIIESGTHKELLEKEGKYHHLYTYQAKI